MTDTYRYFAFGRSLTATGAGTAGFNGQYGDDGTYGVWVSPQRQIAFMLANFGQLLYQLMILLVAAA